MMEIALIALKQTVVMFLLMTVGAVLFKTGKITKDGSRDMANVLLYAVLPCVIIKAFCTEYSEEKSVHLLCSLGLSVICLALSIIVAKVAFPKRPIDHFGTAFSNAGFMGIPLVQAMMGNEAVFFAAPFIALLNVLQWTYGVAVMTGRREAMSAKKVLLNPVLLSFVAGVICFYAKIELPHVVANTLSYIGGMNAPIAMLVLGVYLAQTDLKKLFITAELYRSGVIRLLLIPVLTILLLAFLPAWLGSARMTLLIVASAPVGANVAVYAHLNGLDYTYASKIVCLSTILSIISMPLVMLLAQYIWQAL